MYTGGCLCGAVRYRVSGVPENLCYCHCTSCRRATGSVMVAWASFLYSTYAVTKGRVQEVATSRGVTRGHCAACGSSLTYQHERQQETIDITIATLDEAMELAPVAHIWVQDKLPWVSIDDGLARYQDGGG
jgi:hypothetical protein